MHYGIDLHENADGSFTAYRHEAPNVVTEGKSYEEALEMARYALSDLHEIPLAGIAVYDRAKQVLVMGRVLFDPETLEECGLMPYEPPMLVNIADITEDE